MTIQQWNQIQGVSLRPSYSQSHQQLSSGIQPLDRFLQGGFSGGRINELGMPLGRDARRTLCPFLVKGITEQQASVLWIHGYSRANLSFGLVCHGSSYGSYFLCIQSRAF